MSGEVTGDRAARTYQSAIDRWAGIGPYYAMFPIDFAEEVVEAYSPTGGYMLDPFAGRASSVFAASTLNRVGVGIEINPVGWLYGRVKLRPGKEDRVQVRLQELGRLASAVPLSDLEELPPFFHACYSDSVLRFLVAARRTLNWRTSATDATLMAQILVYLHGKEGSALSNRMRQGKAMAPDYCIRWWKANDSQPPEVDPVAFMAKRVTWRYAKGAPPRSTSRVLLRDCVRALSDLRGQVSRGRSPRFNLLFTSPPYFSVTNYHYDQWLRLWMLGSPSHPAKVLPSPWQKRFEGLANYRHLLEVSFRRSAELLTPGAAVYVRTDARAITLVSTWAALKLAFGSKQLQIVARPLKRKSQTALFGDKGDKPGEVDLVLSGT